MTKDFFIHQLERIGRAWSAPSVEYQKMLWESVKNADGAVLEQALNHLIGEHTVKTLPAVSRIRESMALFRQGGAHGGSPVPVVYNCQACSDYGYGYVEDLLVACICDLGRSLSPGYIADRQKGYNTGKKYLKDTAPGPLPPLPYDPKERQRA